jgi:8-oxo-dGTP diphosphatase
VHRPKYDDWSLPKGKLDPDEPWVVGACREVLEETGLHVVAGRTLGESRYRVVAGGREVPKQVRWWALRADEGAFTATDEVDGLRWLSPARAMKVLTAGYDAEPLRRFLIESPTTRTLLLVRHATAGRRADFEGDDALRPLDRRGHEQAGALARLLPAYAPGRLLTAPLLRCSQTLRPLADATGLALDDDPLLSGAGYEQAAGRTHERLLALVGDDAAHEGSVVACSQGEVLPDAVRALAVGGRVTLPEDLRAPKGSVWALSFAADGCLVDADLVAPPA